MEIDDSAFEDCQDTLKAIFVSKNSYERISNLLGEKWSDKIVVKEE